MFVGGWLSTSFRASGATTEPAIEVLAREIAQSSPRRESNYARETAGGRKVSSTVWIEHPHMRLFSTTFHPCAHITLWLKCRTTCLHKTCSSTCHHMSERLLFPCFVFFPSASRASISLSHFYLFSVLNFNLDDVENVEH